MIKILKIIGVAFILLGMSLVGTLLSYALVHGSALLLGVWGPPLILLILLIGGAWFCVSVSEDA